MQKEEKKRAREDKATLSKGIVFSSFPDRERETSGECQQFSHFYYRATVQRTVSSGRC